MRIAPTGFILYLFFGIALSSHASTVDSVHTIVTPVHCFGLRDGVIRVDTVFGGEKPFFYSLDGVSFTTNPTFDRLRAGEYQLYVRDASGGIKNWPMRVEEPGELQVRLLASASKIKAGLPLEIWGLLNVGPEAIHDVQWSPFSLFPQQDTLQQQILLQEPTQITIIVHDLNGCIARDSLGIEVEKTNYYLPNVIKPESATDAYFTVFAGEGVKKVVSLQIFSRGGSLVFERLDFSPNAPLLGWGGRWNNKWADAGVYLFVAVIEFSDGNRQKSDGTVTVVR